LIFDDTIQEKKWTDKNEIMCWHFEIIKKPIMFSDIKTKKVKRKSEVTKNKIMQQMIGKAVNNQLKFHYVLMDTWFSSQENSEFIIKHKKEFIAALKSNRK